MEIILIRHGLPDRVNGSSGRADPGLSTEGRRQASLLAHALGSERIDALYSSPMRRAVETAAPLSARRGLDIRMREELAEFDRDAPFYIPFEELNRTNDPRLSTLLRGEYSGVDGDGTLHGFQKRVVATIEGLVAAHRGHRIAIVCHGGVLLAYLSHVLGIPEMLFFRPAYTSIHRVLASSEGRRQIVSINETCHLAGLAESPASSSTR